MMKLFRYILLVGLMVVCGNVFGQITINVNSGSSTMCAGSSIGFGSVVTCNSTYQWHKNGVPILNETNQGYSTNSLVNGDVITCVQVTTTLPCVKDTSNKITITILPSASITLNSAASTTNQTVCQNTAITQIKYAITGATGATVNNLPAGVTGIFSNGFLIINGIPTQNGSFNYSINLSGGNCGSNATASGSIVVKDAPLLSFDDIGNPFSPFNNCNNTTGTSAFTINLSNSSTNTSTVNNYQINWGDGNTATNVVSSNFPISHNYTSYGVFNLTISTTNTLGCVITWTKPVINQTNPAVGIQGPPQGSTQGCAPIAYTFKLTNYANNTTGTSFSWDFDDGSPFVVWTIPISDDTIRHSFTKTSCNNPNKEYKIKVTATNQCASTTASIDNIKIFEKPKAAFQASDTSVCINTPVVFTNSSTKSYNGPNCNPNTLYNWNFGDPTSGANNISTLESPTHSFANAGEYIVTLIAEGLCGKDTVTQKVCVQAPLSPTFTTDITTGCIPLVTNLKNTTTVITCGKYAKAWEITSSNAVCTNDSTNDYSYVSPTSLVSDTAIVRFNNQSTYSVKLTMTNVCGVAKSAATNVVVKRKPQVTINAISSVCMGNNITPTGTVDNCTAITPATYNWTFAGGTPSTSNALNPGSIKMDSAGNKLVSLAVTNECGTTNTTQNVTVIAPPTFTATPNPITICNGQPFTINLNSSTSGVKYSWTSVANATISGNINQPIPTATTAINNTLSTTSTTNDTVKYNITIVGPSPSNCAGVTKQVLVIVQAGATTANAGVDSVLCNQTAIILYANNPTVGTGVWKQISGTAATIVDTTLYNTQVTGLTTGTYKFRWTIKSGGGGCASTSDDVNITVNPTSVGGTLNGSTSVCSNSNNGSVNLTGNTGSVQGWEFSTDNGTTWQAVTPINTTTSLTYNNLTVSTQYRVIVKSGVCPQVFSSIATITVNAGVGAANAGNDSILCSAIATTLNGNALAAGTTGAWIQIGTPLATITNATQNNTTVTNLVAGNDYTFRWTVSGLFPCASTQDDVVIKVRPTITTANAGTDILKCDWGVVNTLQLNANNNPARIYETGTWDFISAANGATINNINAANAIITFANPGNYQLTWTIRNDATTTDSSCKKSVDTINVIVKEYPTAGTINGTTALCKGSNGGALNLTGNTSSANIQWQISNDNIVYTDIATANTSSYNVGILNATTWYKVRVYQTNCNDTINSNILKIQVDSISKVGTITPTLQEVCTNSGNVNLLLQNNVGSNINWIYNINNTGYNSFSPTLTTNNIVVNNSPFIQNTATQIKVIDVKAIVASGVCPADTSIAATIKVYPNTETAVAGLQQNLCFQTSTILNATTPANGVGTWSQLNGPNAATFADTANPHSALNNLIVGSYLLKWKLSGSTNNICQPSFDTVRINNYDTIINKIKSTADTLCSNQALQINSFATVTGGDGNYTYQWQQSIDGINWINIPTNSTQEAYSTTAATTLYFRRNITSSTCTSSSNIIIIIVQPGLGNNIISANQNTCINTTPNLLNGALPTGGSGVYQYQWQQLNNGIWTNILNETSISYQPPLTIILGDTSFRRIVSSGFCNGDISNVVIISTKPDSKAFYTFANDKLCTPALIDSANIKAQDYPLANGVYQWYANNILIGTSVLFPGYTIVNNGDTVYIKLKTISPYGCKSDSFEHKFYTVQTPIVSFTKSINKGCGPLTVSFVNITTPLNAPTYKWDFGNGQTSVLQQPPSIIFYDDTSKLRHDTTYYIKLTAFTQCDSIVYTDSVTVLPKPKALFQPDTTVGCSIFHFRAFNNSLGTHCTYFWDYGDSTYSTDTSGGYVYHDFKTNVTDTFSVKLKAVNVCGADSGIVKIVVFPNTIVPKLIVDGSSNYGCAPVQVRFVNNTVGANKFTIKFGDGSLLYLTNKNPDTVYHTYQTGGTFTATMKAENGCTDSTVSLALIFYDKPTANFSTTFNQYCKKETIQFKNLSDTALSFEWWFGDGATSTNLHPTHRYLNAGNYTITLIAKSTNPTGAVCTDTIRKTITIHDLPISSFTNNAAIQNCQPYYFVGVTNLLPSEIANWTFYDAFSNDTTQAGNVGVHSFKQVGIYKVQLVTINVHGCTDTSSTNVKVIETPKVTFTMSDTLSCVPGKSVLCTNQTTYSSADAVNYQWYVNGVLQATTKDFNYNFNVPVTITVAANFVVKLVAINSYGCRDSATKSFVIYPKAQPSFAINANAGCVPFNLQFYNTTQYANLYNWYLDGQLFSTSSVPNPIVLNSPATTYTIKLVANHTLGCGADSIAKQFTTYTKPVADFLIPNKNSCTGILNIQCFDLSSVVGASITKWNWIFGDGATDTLKNPTHTYTTAGHFNVGLMAIDNRGCKSDITYQRVANFGKPKANFSIGNVCVKNPLLPVNLSTPGLGSTAITNYVWNFGDGNYATGIQPIYVYQNEGNYIITLIVTSDSSCVADTLQKTVTVYGKPTADFKFENNCVKENTLFTNTSLYGFGQSAIGNSKWTFGDGGTSNNFNAAHIFNATGDYVVQLAVSGNRCPNLIDSIKKVITVHKPRDPVIYPRIEGVRGTPIQLYALSGGVQYNWLPITGLDNAGIQNPIGNYTVAHPNIINYTINITDSLGCKVKDKQEVWLFADADIFVPTAFTPNGDGANDILKPLYVNIAKVNYFRIFDRWGKVVFETSDMGKAWDGTLNGSNLPMETYSWMIGAITQQGKELIRKGNTTLIRN